jgi:hypothetical protein
MRSKAVILAGMGAAVSIFCTAHKATPTPPPGQGAGRASQAASLTLDPRGEVVSGCVVGAPLVKKKIILTPGGAKGCKAQVVPPSVCVVPGGVIRWRVQNHCDRLEGTPQDPALRITNLHPLDGGTTGDWLGAVCETWFATVEEGSPQYQNLLFCDVPGNVEDGQYKYDLAGSAVDTLDPYIEVRRPR